MKNSCYCSKSLIARIKIHKRFPQIIKNCCQSNHGTIIRTGITFKKIPCYMRDTACRWFIVENAKIFRSYVKYF